MSFLYKPWTSEYQSQYTWKLRNQFRKPQDILEKHLEELKQLQDENFKKLSSLEETLKNKFIPEDDELYITEKKIKKEESLVLPKLSDSGNNITKAENVELPPIKRPSSASSNKGSKAGDVGVKEEVKHKEINEQINALISHYRGDGYGNKPFIGNKPTSFEYEKMKKIPTSKTTIKNFDENLKEKRAKIYDAYRKEIDLRRLKHLFPYVNFDELNYNAQTQTYDDGIISGTYLSEYGSQYVNWNHPPFPYSRRFDRCAKKIAEKYENNVGTSTLEDKENNIISNSITSLSKNIDKLGLNDEDLEICEKCNGYFIKRDNGKVKSDVSVKSSTTTNTEKIVKFDKQPPK
ncbi:hypothetical protein BCR36DRAFT_403503 [Piromyces finnis]|uniref:Uncharacterized protein n=1 Tax=Piromyces finnis TaxID=1754191 RepID=A0A1Y1VF93_9FUNG|nr:hypothetical protein BCR36DRAFT_403503 [Piromyces finnis]|eukprot:ORX53872.1 hypothetical protein BCR36DRAFT_403503 [Piromyces finnis]